MAKLWLPLRHNAGMTLVDKALFQPTPTFRARRKRVLARIQVEGGDTPAQDAMVRDISATGMSATARSHAPAAGEMVSVTLPGGSLLWGVVRWSEGKSFGVEFDPASRQGPVPALA